MYTVIQRKAFLTSIIWTLHTIIMSTLHTSLQKLEKLYIQGFIHHSESRGRNKVVMVWGVVSPHPQLGQVIAYVPVNFKKNCTENRHSDFHASILEVDVLQPCMNYLYPMGVKVNLFATYYLLTIENWVTKITKLL